MLQQVLAQGQINTTVSGPAGSDAWTMQALFGYVLNLVLAAGFSLTLIMLAMGFVQYIMAQGDKLGVEKAQKWVTYSVIGGLGLFLVFAIRSAVMRTIGGQTGLNVGTNVNI